MTNARHYQGEKETARTEHEDKLRQLHLEYQDILNYNPTSKEFLRITEEKNALKKKNKELVRRDNYNDSAHYAILKEDLDPKGTKGKKEKKEGQIGGKKGTPRLIPPL